MASRLKESVVAKTKLCRLHESQIRQCRTEFNARFNALEGEVHSMINDEIKPDQDRKKREADKINREIDLRNEKLFEKNRKLREEIRKFDEEIRKNNEEIRRSNEEIRRNDEERRRRLESNRQDSERRQAPAEHKRRDFLEDIQNIAEVIESQIIELENSVQDVKTMLEKAKQTIEAMRTEVGDLHGFNRTVTEALDKPLDIGAVERISRAVLKVRFVKGTGKDKYNGRIDYDGEWRLENEIDIREIFSFPTIVGCIDSRSVLVTDRVIGDMHTYLLNINTKRTERVIAGTPTSCVISCSLLNDGKVVCGKRRAGHTITALGQPLTGCISVYDRQWKVIRDIQIPRNTTRDDTWVDVAADPDGMIIAAEWGQPRIYVVNSKDGSVLQTITCAGNIAMRGVLSSGRIIARPSSDECKVFSIARDGLQREIPCRDSIRNICIDPLTDALYVVTSDSEYKTCVVNHVKRKGSSAKNRVASISLSTKLTGTIERRSHLALSQVIMTSSGKLIACDGNSIQCITKDIYSVV